MRMITSMIEAFSITDLNSPNFSSIFLIGFSGLSVFGEDSGRSGVCCEVDIICAFFCASPLSYYARSGGLKVSAFLICFGVFLSAMCDWLQSIKKTF